MNHHTPRTLRNRLAAALTGLGLFLAAFSTGQASPFHTYSLDTSAYAGTAGYLAFDLIDGDATLNNLVSVTNLSTDGVMSDTSNFSIADASFFNEVLRDIVLGSTLSFNFQLSENFGGGTPDSFSLYLLDSSGFFSVFATIDPLGTDALFQVDVTGTPGGNVSVYAGSLRVPDQGSTLALGGLAFGLLAVARRFGARRMAA